MKHLKFYLGPEFPLWQPPPHFGSAFLYIAIDWRSFESRVLDWHSCQANAWRLSWYSSALDRLNPNTLPSPLLRCPAYPSFFYTSCRWLFEERVMCLTSVYYFVPSRHETCRPPSVADPSSPLSMLLQTGFHALADGPLPTSAGGSLRSERHARWPEALLFSLYRGICCGCFGSPLSRP